MPARLTREQKDNALIHCRGVCGRTMVAKGNFYFSVKNQRYVSSQGVVKYCVVEGYSRVCKDCHALDQLARKRKNPQLYNAISLRSYHRKYYKGKYSKQAIEARRKLNQA